ncbi:hypothetical protein BIFANG_03101 [Bifidobacterium angulatum DSM 20098 = JCM 7096]|uniref:Uncharacterized protein n=1 Tax=Bifidobacterium angulatum DSM 20098 = JCM 7096 TaxID=518635 RepID=C4FFJ3_9BIFI|nr:hypothetical protein BIFANG_03101 [Bifidobacterium angulatum DSM 20098 = JCM 7096]BAQ96606.1 hypothetical protein BBAG_0984 [Bifidobacterium angulatum DSM 20098 = JCM 7096]
MAGRSAHPYTSCIRLRIAIRCVLTYACRIHMPAQHTGKQYLRLWPCSQTLGHAGHLAGIAGA